MQIFPSTQAAFVDKVGRILQPFISYLQQFTTPPSGFLQVTVGISPFSYEAKETGNVFLTGGTISAVHLLRGSVDLNFSGPQIIPVAVKDVVVITYTVLPTIYFIPSYGQNTNG